MYSEQMIMSQLINYFGLVQRQVQNTCLNVSVRYKHTLLYNYSAVIKLKLLNNISYKCTRWYYSYGSNKFIKYLMFSFYRLLCFTAILDDLLSSNKFVERTRDVMARSKQIKMLLILQYVAHNGRNPIKNISTNLCVLSLIHKRITKRAFASTRSK